VFAGFCGRLEGPPCAWGCTDHISQLAVGMRRRIRSGARTTSQWGAGRSACRTGPTGSSWTGVTLVTRRFGERLNEQAPRRRRGNRGSQRGPVPARRSGCRFPPLVYPTHQKVRSGLPRRSVQMSGPSPLSVRPLWSA
jgi:hypothetical protein